MTSPPSPSTSPLILSYKSLPPSPPTSPPQRQPREKTPHNRPSKKVRPRKSPLPLRLKQIRQGPIRLRLIHPLCRPFQDSGAGGRGSDGGGLEGPVGFRVEVAGVEGEAVGLEDGGVPGGLGGVDVVGDEIGVGGGLCGGSEGLLVLLGDIPGGRAGGGGGVPCGVEAEQSIRVERIQRRPAPEPVICQFRPASIPRHTVFLPFLHVHLTHIPIILCISLLAHELRKFGHGFDTDNTFQREIGLQSEPAGEIIRAELVVRFERVVDEVSGPLFPEGVGAREPFAGLVGSDRGAAEGVVEGGDTSSRFQS